MDRSRSHHRQLLVRFCSILGLAIPVAAVVPAYGADVSADGTCANEDGGAERRGALGWADGELPDVSRLSPSERANLAEAWAADGRLEHASVTSYGRFALELLATGAPPSLVANAHHAALDEVRHARMCFALASAYSGERMSLAPFDFGRITPVEIDLVALVTRTFLEGCAGETLAAVHAEEALAKTADPAVRRALTTIARDEAAHAEIAWRAVSWLVALGDARGEPVREALARAVDHLGTWGVDALSADRRSRGLGVGGASRAVADRALSEVVIPCALALLGAGEAPARGQIVLDTEIDAAA